MGYPNAASERELIAGEDRRQMISDMGLEQVEAVGYEADDIIGTIAHRESHDGHEVLCVTSDKDYFQLVPDKVKILRPAKQVGEYDVYDAEKVKEKFGVSPEHVIDALALIGDSSDNVPGVKGIGEKTAMPLVEQFGSVEEIYDHLDDVDKPGTRKKLQESKDNAFLSKKLVTIHTDVPVDAKRVALERKPMNFAALDVLCEELGFGAIAYGINTDESVCQRWPLVSGWWSQPVPPAGRSPRRHRRRKRPPS